MELDRKTQHVRAVCDSFNDIKLVYYDHDGVKNTFSHRAESSTPKFISHPSIGSSEPAKHNTVMLEATRINESSVVVDVTPTSLRMTKDMAATFGKALVSTAAKQCALIVTNQVVTCYRSAPPKSKSGDEYECVSSAQTKSGYDIYTISCSCFAKHCVRLVYNEGKTFIDSHYGETVRSDDGDDLHCIPSDGWQKVVRKFAWML